MATKNGRQKPLTKHHPTRGRRLPPEILTHEEMLALLDACPKYLPYGLRNRALIAIMYRSGLRVSEAIALMPKDVDIARGAIRVLHGKGDKSRTVGIDPGALEIVQRWIACRTGLGFADREPLLCSTTGRWLTASYVRVLMPKLAHRAGIAKRVHAHGLRHTHAAQLREEGIDIGIISKQLGHASIATTASYLDHIAPWAVIEIMHARVWIASSL